MKANTHTESYIERTKACIADCDAEIANCRAAWDDADEYAQFLLTQELRHQKELRAIYVADLKRVGAC